MPEKKKLFIGCLLHTPLSPASFANFWNFLGLIKEKYSFDLFIASGTYSCRSKNNVIQKALQTNADFLLFYDLDLLVSPAVVEKLVESNKEIVSALFFSEDKALPCFKVFKDNNYADVLLFPGNKLFSVDALSVGCLLVKREVLENLSNSLKKKPFFDLEYSAPTEVLDEDIYFSRLLKEKGFDLFVDPQAVVPRPGGLIDGVYFTQKYGKTIREAVEKQNQGGKANA